MNRLLVVALLLAPVTTLAQYPAAFTWGRYVPRVQDQLRQGPCYAHAATGVVEAMYNLSFHGPGTTTGTKLDPIAGIDLSERQVYSCAHPSGVASLRAALEYVASSGAVTAACIPYPSTACSEASDQWPRVVLGSYDCPAEQVRCGVRVRALSQDVSSEASLGAAAIQGLLVQRGPLAVSFADGPLHFGGSHGYVLHGWRTVGGSLRWLLRDTWPCAAKDAIELEESNDPAGFHLAQLFGQAASNTAFAVTAVIPERYASGAWVPYGNGPAPFELEPENQLVKIVPSGGCYNHGTYRVSGLEKLPGATVIGWSVRTASQRITPTVRIAWSGVQTGDAPAVLTGNGEEMTLVATLQRANGLRENVTLYVGAVGIPYVVNQSSACAGGRREVGLTLSANAPAGSATTARMVFAPSPDNSYYVMGNGSSYAYVVFNRTVSADFRVQVTSSSPGCSLALDDYRYVMGYPCFTYPGYPY